MNKDFEVESIGRLLIKFSIPAIFGYLVVMLYSTVDRIFIGQRLGAEALAGITLIGPFSLISISLGSLIGTGGSTLVSIKLGEKKVEECKKIVGNQISLFLLVCTFIVIFLQIYLVDIIDLMGATGATSTSAITYGRIFIPVIFFQCFTYGLNGVVRANGFPKFALVTTIVGSLLNIILDYIFLYPLNMGVFGAGLATFIALFIASILNVWYFFSGRYPLTIQAPHLKIEKEIVISICKLGASAGLITFANAMVAFIFNWQLNMLSGSSAVAAYGIYTTVHSVVIMMTMGIVQGGMQPIVGYNLGAGHYKRIIETIKLTFIASLIISLLLMFIIQVFPEHIIKLFLDDEKTIAIGSNALRLGFSVIPIMIITIFIAGVYQALGEAKLAFIFNFIRKVAIFVPSILIFPALLGINGVWLSRPIADVVSAVIMIIYYKKTYQELKAKGNEEL